MAQQVFRGPDGSIYTAHPGGGYVVTPPPSASPASLVTPLGPRDPSKARSESREDERLRLAQEAAARAEAAAARQEDANRRAEERAQRQEEAEARRNAGKPLSDTAAKDLTSDVDVFAGLKNAALSFSDDYAGNALTGRAENWAQALNSGWGTPGQRGFWSQFDAIDMRIRNSMFGASLTDGEKAAYEATTVSPSMDPAIVRENIAKRASIIQGALQRKTGRLRVLHNKDEIDAQLGDYAADLLPKAARDEAKLPPPTDFNAIAKQPKTAAAGAPTVNLGGPEETVATGKTRSQYDPGASKALDRLIRSGASFDEMAQWASRNKHTIPDRSNYEAAVAFAKANPGYAKPLGEVVRTVPNSIMNRIAASPAATIATQAGNALTSGYMDEIGGGLESLATGEDWASTTARLDRAKQAQAKANPWSALAGNVLGGSLAMASGGGALARVAPGALARVTARLGAGRAAMLGDGLYGAAYGSGENNDNRLLGAGVGLAGGVVGNRIGAAATRGVGATMRGVVNPAVDRLRAAGVPLTAGEVLGGGWKKVQDATTSVFGPGSLLTRRYAEGREGLSRALFNEAGQIVDPNPINAIGAEGLTALNARKNTAYSDALDNVTIDAANPAFVADQAALRGHTGRLLPNVRDDVNDALHFHIDGNVDPATQTLTGRNFQEGYRGLARAPRERGVAPYQHEHAQAMRAGQDVLATALEDQNPGAYAAFLRANSANRHLNVLGNAVNAAKSQVNDAGVALPTPNQFSTAATQSGTTYGSKLQAAMGNKPFYHADPHGGAPTSLINDAQQVMTNQLAESGTVPRAIVATVLAGGAGGGLGALTGGGEGAGVGTVGGLSALALLNTRAGQAAAVRALLDRAAAFRNLGELTVNHAPRVGRATGLAGVIGGQALLPPR